MQSGYPPCCNALSSYAQQQYLVTLLPELYQQQSTFRAAVADEGGYISSYVPDHTYRTVLAQHGLARVATLPGMPMRVRHLPSHRTACIFWDTARQSR